MILGDYPDDDGDDEDSDDVTEILQIIDDYFVDLDMLYQAFSIVKDKWAVSDDWDSKNILSLFKTHHMHAVLVYDEVLSISDENEILSTTSDFYNIDLNTLLH